jgi:hypothetical protein
MPGEARLTREKVEEAFRLVGEYLRDRKTLGEIVVHDGRAIMLQFEWRQSTQDVDAVIRSAGNHGIVQKAIQEAADRLGLPRSWLNESVAMYRLQAEDEKDRLPIGMYPSYERPGLRVLAATPEYMLALKIIAMGERESFDDRDFEDAANLGADTGIASTDDLRAFAEAYADGGRLPPKVEARLEELYAAIEERRRTGPKVR